MTIRERIQDCTTALLGWGRLRRTVTSLQNRMATIEGDRTRRYRTFSAAFRYLGTQGSRHAVELGTHDQQLRELVAQVATLVELNRRNPARARDYDQLYVHHLALVVPADGATTAPAEEATEVVEAPPPIAAAGGGA